MSDAGSLCRAGPTGLATQGMFRRILPAGSRGALVTLAALTVAAGACALAAWRFTGKAEPNWPEVIKTLALAERAPAPDLIVGRLQLKSIGVTRQGETLSNRPVADLTSKQSTAYLDVSRQANQTSHWHSLHVRGYSHLEHQECLMTAQDVEGLERALVNYRYPYGVSLDEAVNRRPGSYREYRGAAGNPWSLELSLNEGCATQFIFRNIAPVSAGATATAAGLFEILRTVELDPLQALRYLHLKPRNAQATSAGGGDREDGGALELQSDFAELGWSSPELRYYRKNGVITSASLGSFGEETGACLPLPAENTDIGKFQTAAFDFPRSKSGSFMGGERTYEAESSEGRVRVLLRLTGTCIATWYVSQHRYGNGH